MSHAARSTLRHDLAVWARSEGLCWIFIFKMLAAALTTLWLAMRLDMPQPSTAVMAVFIVMQPQSGQVIAKGLHRLLVLSATYRQSSQAPAASLERDVDNALYGRAPLRRLEAEAVRDAMLATAGVLDRQQGGSLLKVKNRAYFFDHTSKDLTDYTSDRRSLYLPVVRNNVYDLFQLLDYPDAAVPSGDRATTTVAPQALLMLNSEFVMQSADRLAARLLTQEGSDENRIAALWLRTYGRSPAPAEVGESLKYLGELEQALAAGQPVSPDNRRAAWNVLCHTTVAANEFVYLR